MVIHARYSGRPDGPEQQRRDRGTDQAERRPDPDCHVEARKIDSGTSGALAMRASTNMNAPTSITPTSSGASTPAEPQPRALVRTMA